MKALGARIYRFSIAWPRVFPQGGGQPNPKGLDFYSRLVDELLANGIQPFATLYHWTFRRPCRTASAGWESRETFGGVCGVMRARGGAPDGCVKYIFTINEFGAFVELGYKNGVHAPGLKLPPARFNQTRHHAVLATAWRCRRSAPREARHQVGLAENMTICAPVIETAEHIDAARADRELNAQY